MKNLFFLLFFVQNVTAQTVEPTLYRRADKKDSLFVAQNAALINQMPTESNHTVFVQLAYSLWNLSRLAEAKIMLEKIEASTAPFYTETYEAGSDLGNGEKTTYGYGSYTFNYKNTACQYLAKICIEEKKFKKALKYITLADKKYIINYSCGTGHNSYRAELSELYGYAYLGLGNYNKVIKILLPYMNNWDCDTKPLNIALVQKYTPKELTNEIDKAMASITFDDNSKHQCVIEGKAVMCNPSFSFVFINQKRYLGLSEGEHTKKDAEKELKEFFVSQNLIKEDEVE
jgi:hypothetical protein